MTRSSPEKRLSVLGSCVEHLPISLGKTPWFHPRGLRVRIYTAMPNITALNSLQYDGLCTHCRLAEGFLSIVKVLRASASCNWGKHINKGHVKGPLTSCGNDIRTLELQAVTIESFVDSMLNFPPTTHFNERGSLLFEVRIFKEYATFLAQTRDGKIDTKHVVASIK